MRRLPRDTFVREPIPFEAAFLAGKAFLRYRRRGGQRAAPLPDFFIGAHAAVAGHRLLTRDPSGPHLFSRSRPDRALSPLRGSRGGWPGSR